MYWKLFHNDEQGLLKIWVSIDQDIYQVWPNNILQSYKILVHEMIYIGEGLIICKGLIICMMAVNSQSLGAPAATHHFMTSLLGVQHFPVLSPFSTFFFVDFQGAVRKKLQILLNINRYQLYVHLKILKEGSVLRGWRGWGCGWFQLKSLVGMCCIFLHHMLWRWMGSLKLQGMGMGPLIQGQKTPGETPSLN